MIYDALLDFREECREEFREIKSNARAHTQEMHEHKKETAAEFKELEKRIEKAEEPRKMLHMLKNAALWIVAIGAAIGHLKGML